ncbi:MAG: hypothetical protein R3B40_10535 [Polyangiales bacterium]|nr:hypothetical protein [Myxococcales bacterium]
MGADGPSDGRAGREARGGARRERRAPLGRDLEDQLLSAQPLDDPEDPTSGRNLAILFGCPTVVVLLLCLGGGLAWHFARGFTGDAGDPGAPPTTPLDPTQGGAPIPPPPPPLPAGGGVGGTGGSGSDPAQAAMRPRYRPGPYVTVQGLLPSGLTNQQRLTTDQRVGRTVETPWIVPGAELRAAPPPAASGPGSPALRIEGDLAQPLTVIAGSPSQLAVVASPGDGAEGGVQALQISFDGYPGHFWLPAVVDSELGHVRVTGVDAAAFRFGMDAPVGPGGAPITDKPFLDVVMRVSSVDEAGRVSPPAARTVRVMTLGTGDVEVTLSMNAATDLDLYVVEGTGTMIYYGNTTAPSGGHLDLDANAGCGSQMGVNAEHIFWRTGQAPAGTYQVRVAHYRNCRGSQPVDYTLTVRNCGETAVFSGRFEGPGSEDHCTQDPGTRRDWCQTVVNFDVSPCQTAAP